MILATVLKSGGAYGPEHLAFLEAQLDAPLIAFTDIPEVLDARGPLARPLRHDLPGWWSKMELFDPESREDVAFFDLDTVIRQRPSFLTDPVRYPLILRDFYRPEGLQSSVMLIPGGFKPFIWRRWREADPAWVMTRLGRLKLGDQAFIEDCGTQHWRRLQDEYPGEFVSWKADALDETPPSDDARVIVFHGEPKPWSLPSDRQFWRHEARA